MSPVDDVRVCVRPKTERKWIIEYKTNCVYAFSSFFSHLSKRKWWSGKKGVFLFILFFYYQLIWFICVLLTVSENKKEKNIFFLISIIWSYSKKNNKEKKIMRKCNSTSEFNFNSHHRSLMVIFKRKTTLENFI